MVRALDGRIRKSDVRAFNALYQQRPVVEEGDYFKLDWFSPFVHLPESISTYGASDYAVTEGGGDFTEHGIFALDPLGTLYIIDWVLYEQITGYRGT